MQQYHDMLQHILDNGIETTDRTGTGTISVFGYQNRYDLSKGFPLVTTKKLHTRSIFHELLWFLSGDTSNRSLQRDGVKIWNEWEGAHGSLGPVYGAAWRYWGSHERDNLVQIPVRDDLFADFEEPKVVWHQKIDCDLNTNQIWAIEKIENCDSKNSRYKVQTRTGFVGEISRPNWKSLKSVYSFDGYVVSVADVGFLGAPSCDPCDDRLYSLWRNMILRCYDKDHPQYHLYGGAGVTVSKIWHSYERFRDTIASVPFFHLWVDGNYRVEIDKDYYGSNVYGPSTCIFLKSRDNKSMSDGTALRIKGGLYESWSHFEDATGNRSDYMRKRLASGKRYKEFSPEDVEIIQPEPGHLWRREIFFDQIKWLIQEIKDRPDSRRLIVSGWNPIDLPQMALPPCHTLWQVKILGGKLHLHLYQRSADTFLGVPFNIASYALLTMMLAKVTGYEAGDFVHSFGDAHIYLNHIDQVKLQLSRAPRPLPTLRFARDVKELSDFRYEDFVIEGYDPHPHIAGEVSV